MDLLDFLAAEHREIEAMFQEYAALAKGALRSKESVAAKVCVALERHLRIEEELLFPEMNTSREASESIEAARQEWNEIDTLVRGIRESNPSDPLFDTNFEALKEMFREHAAEEEETLLPAALDLLGAGRLEEMAQRAEAVRAELETPQTEEEPPIPPVTRL